MRTDQLSNHDKELMDSFYAPEDQCYEIQEANKPDMSEVQALEHILSVIDTKGLENCTDKTQDAYKVLKELSYKLSTEYVVYRP